MKNTIIIFLFIFSIAAGAQVRNYKKPAVNAPQAKSQPQKKTTKYNSSNADTDSKFGIVGGLLISNETGDDIEKASSRTGFFAGFSYKTNFSETIGLETNLVYATMGAVFKDEFNEDLKDNLDYLQLPIMLNIKASKVVNFKIGPQLGYLMSATIDGNEYIEYLNTLDYGVVAGVGIDFPNTNFGINSKFYYGLADIYNEEYGFDNPVTNTSFSVGIHYYF